MIPLHAKTGQHVSPGYLAWPAPLQGSDIAAELPLVPESPLAVSTRATHPHNPRASRAEPGGDQIMQGPWSDNFHTSGCSTFGRARLVWVERRQRFGTFRERAPGRCCLLATPGAGRDGPRGWGWVVRLGIVHRKIMARVDHCRQEPTVIGSAPDLDEEERGAGWKRWQGAGGPGVALRQCPSLRRRIDPGTAACRKEAWR